MSTIEQLFSTDLIRSIGWSLVHSLWQGAILVILFALLMIFMNRFSSKTRYFISLNVLFLFLLSFIITFSAVYKREKQKEDVVAVNTLDLYEEASQLEQQVLLPDDNTVISQENEIGPIESQSKFRSYIFGFQKYYNQHLPLIVTVWLLGVLLLTLKLLGGLAYAQRLKKYKVTAVTGKLLQRFNTLKSRFGLNFEIAFLESAIAKVPQAIGYFKPVILMPMSLLSGMSAEQIDTIIMHELAHIYRRDYLFNIIQSVIEVLFFYHPAVWWISSVIREERENCCDDMVVEMSGDKMTYVKTLVDIEEYQQVPVSAAVAFSGRKGSKLFNRIKRISLKPNKNANFSEGFIAACIIFFSLFIVGFSARASVKRSEFPVASNEVEEIATTDTNSQVVSVNGDFLEPEPVDIEQDTNKPTQKPERREMTNRIISNADSIVLLAGEFSDVEVQKEDGQTSIIIKTNVEKEKKEEEKTREVIAELEKRVRDKNSFTYSNGKLFDAVESKDYIQVEKLLDEGVSPDEMNRHREVPLVEAAKRGMYSIARLLLDAGANTELSEKDGWTALHLAIRENKYAVVKLLIDYGADVNAETHKGWTPLMEAVDEDYAIMKELIANGANINATQFEGRSVLMEAVKADRYENVKQLLENGADPNIYTFKGYSCLMEAANEQYSISVLLIKYGIDVNQMEHNGWTALYNVIKNGRTDLLKLYLKNGADATTPSYKGMTPHQYARNQRKYEMARIIKAANE